MHYEIPHDIRERMQARLEGGRYKSEDEVLRGTMDALDQIEQNKLTRWNDRNRLANLPLRPIAYHSPVELVAFYPFSSCLFNQLGFESIEGKRQRPPTLAAFFLRLTAGDSRKNFLFLLSPVVQPSDRTSR